MRDPAGEEEWAGHGEWRSDLGLGVDGTDGRQGASYASSCPSGSAMFSSTGVGHCSRPVIEPLRARVEWCREQG